jgi:RNA polymerase sigma factor (sigma-70 family)
MTRNWDRADLDRYFKSIRAHDRVTVEQEVSLARAWRERQDAAARDRLISANLRLVVAIARRYADRGVPLDELIAEGNVGLVTAVDNFNPEVGCRFSTYAAFWIRQSIAQSFARNGLRFLLSRQDRRSLALLESAVDAFVAQQGRPPTDDELAQRLGWTCEQVRLHRGLMVTRRRPESLDDDSTRTGVAMKNALQSHEDAPGAAEGSAIPADALERLNDLEREVVQLRFGLNGNPPLHVKSIAAVVDRPVGDVRRTLMRALAQLKRFLVAQTTPDDDTFGGYAAA